VRVERLAHVVVATPDPAGARDTFRRCFGFPPCEAGPDGALALQVGGARIELVTPAPGSPLAAAVPSGEGMAGIALAVASLDEAATALERAGIAFETATAGGHRTIHVDPAAAHGVRLALIDGR
jgi:catechol 2,3-dioxygenase-like lactoylglutathione lyase family enzyme